jgi:flagellar biosynthetic protein FliP
MKYYANRAFLLILVLVVSFLWSVPAFAQDAGDMALQMTEQLRDVPISSTVRILVVLTALSFLPALVLGMTPFTRFIIVLSMLRQAVGLQQSPPNQVLVGLSLFLSMMLMQSTLDQVYETSINPFLNGDMEVLDAFEAFMAPMRRFMISNTRQEDLQLILSLGDGAMPEQLSDVGHASVVSAFILSELKTAFIIGVKIYLPFLVIDVVVANILLGMGMMVLPPVVLSLPLKILLFVLMDGWSLLISMMAAGFYGI